MNRNSFCAILIVLILTLSILYEKFAEYRCQLNGQLLAHGVYVYECVTTLENKK